MIRRVVCYTQRMATTRGARALFANNWPILIYVLAYDAVRYIPDQFRPAIHTDILPQWEQRLCGTVPGLFFAEHHALIFDLLAAIPYALHFLSPLVFILWLSRQPGHEQQHFAQAFTLLNIIALITQLLFPTAPPWYVEKYGTTIPNYSMVGDPAALARVDYFLGLNYFTNLFAQSRIVFGAYPSMHGAWPLLMAMIARRSSPLLALCLILYTAWMWWAALYLQHHYLVDLLSGALFAWIAYRTTDK